MRADSQRKRHTRVNLTAKGERERRRDQYHTAVKSVTREYFKVKCVFFPHEYFCKAEAAERLSPQYTHILREVFQFSFRENTILHR